MHASLLILILNQPTLAHIQPILVEGRSESIVISQAMHKRMPSSGVSKLRSSGSVSDTLTQRVDRNTADNKE